jgi:hypothetical protein
MAELGFYDYDPVTHSYEAVEELKQAMTWVQTIPLSWQSNDGFSLYSAVPSDAEEILPRLGRLPESSGPFLSTVMNVWTVDRVTRNQGGDLPLRMDRMLLGAGYLALDASVEFDPLAPDFDHEGLIESLNQAIMRNRETETQSSVESLAHLDHALFDLVPLREAAITNWREAWISMSDQERRMERMMKFAFLVDPETSKTAKPSWWAISEGHRLHTVHASSPDEAAAILDEYHENRSGAGIAPMFFIERCDDETTAHLDEVLDPEVVTRLIPYSHVPYPEDFDNMTDEQRAAFDKLQRP